MADASHSLPAAPAVPGGHAARSGPDALLLIFVPNLRAMEEVVATVLDSGLHATVIESRALSDVLRRELPMFEAIASTLPAPEPGRVLVCITSQERAARVLADLARGAAPPHGPFGVSVPVSGWFGIAGSRTGVDA